MKNCSIHSTVNVTESRVFTGLGIISGCGVTVEANLGKKRSLYWSWKRTNISRIWMKPLHLTFPFSRPLENSQKPFHPFKPPHFYSKLIYDAMIMQRGKCIYQWNVHCLRCPCRESVICCLVALSTQYRSSEIYNQGFCWVFSRE